MPCTRELGDIVSRLNNDVSEVQRVAAETVLASVGNLLFLAGALGMLAFLAPRLLLVALAFLQYTLDSRVVDAEKRLRTSRGAPPELREEFERTLAEVTLEKQAEIAEKFDRIHSVERAREVGSLSEIVDPQRMRAFLIEELEQKR